MLKKFIKNSSFKNRNYLIKFSFLLVISNINAIANEQVKKLLEAYPYFLQSYSGNEIVWKDGEKMKFDDYIDNKTFNQKLNSPSLKEQLSIEYLKITENRNHIPNPYEDAGRIRYEPFFKKCMVKMKEKSKRILLK